MASPDVFDEPGLDDDDFRLDGPGRKDGMGHKCGVFGVFGREDAAILTALGLHALQHRGQEACGIVTFDGKGGTFRSERHMGLVGGHADFLRGCQRTLGGRGIVAMESTARGCTISYVLEVRASTSLPFWK